MHCRLLLPADEAEAREEFRRFGVDPGPEAAAFACNRLVRITDASPATIRRLRKEVRGLGGRTTMAGDGSAGLFLVGSTATLRGLCRRLPTLSGDWAGISAQLTDLLDNLETSPPYLAGRTCRISLDRPRIMGVVNVTPDSFSDGGRYFTPDSAVRRGRDLAAEGADLLDIGGESTRPGAAPVSAQEEIDRVVPVIEALRREIDLPLSVDTTKAAVARAAISAGAEFINDISGLRLDPEMLQAAAAGGAGVFLMHTRGRPEEMQRDTFYRDLIGEVVAYLGDSLAMAATAGICAEKLAIDPGIGFGKSAEGNLEILRRLQDLAVLGRPILLGTSRKSFIGRLLGQPDPGQRLAGTLATVALGVAGGAHFFRVHDVRAARETALVAWAVCRRASSQGDLPLVGS
jgi:dihydropteroate synthase